MPVVGKRAVWLLLAFVVGCTKTAPEALPKPPRVLSIAPTAERARLLVVLHGVGSNADNMFETAKVLAPMAPDAEVLIPDGLFPWSGGPSGREWYSLQNITDAERAGRVEPAAVALSAWLDEELASRKLDGSKLIVVGFSQGAGLAEWLAVRRKPAPVAIALSGRFFEASGAKAEGARVLVVHGTDDRVVPLAYGQMAFTQLQARGANVELEVFPQLGHTIDQRVLSRVQQFLTR
ncbi:MAG: hypothetical protein DI536_32740 [Archangium gephyra]|uniref:Phospholipase/carboxylesterase/thioesterase domain-containing protein n=1 Tax=Archangium gephyra TaxID=48 RepID=A0A2W5SR51_9BACT|nr:MAG: hypothetical protein DI536_32740 [Archangium gephyra]